jgi:hypothetical protein
MIKKTLKNLIIFGAFAFLFISTNNALAYYYNNTWYPDGRYLLSTSDNPNAPTMDYRNAIYTTNVNPNTYSTNPYNNSNNPTQTPIINNYYTTPTPTVVSNTNTKTVTTPATTQKDNSVNANNTDGTLKPLTDTASSNNLTALSLNGSGGFMPSSIWQWLLVIFLILVIIIIARILGKKPATNSPHSTPAH